MSGLYLRCTFPVHLNSNLAAMKFAIARVSALLCIAFGLGQAASVRDTRISSPTAIATNADVEYCFARVRGLNPERLPPAYLVLRLHVRVSYRNNAARPMILPLERRRTVYTALQPGAMKIYKDDLGLFDPSVKVMKDLPGDVSPDSPVDPKNDIFAVIPAGAEMSPPLMEEIILPVNRKASFRKYPDLRGHRVYVKLRFVHRELAAALQANLSDRWSRFGVPWTGTLTTNTILVDVPASPQAGPCQDRYTPAHPVVGDDDKK
jgi:hypothetical protein